MLQKIKEYFKKFAILDIVTIVWFILLVTMFVIIFHYYKAEKIDIKQVINIQKSK